MGKKVHGILFIHMRIFTLGVLNALPMLKSCILTALLISATSWGQNHGDNLNKIHTLEEAEDYASKFREVFVGKVNAEKDVIFFDAIDTANLADYVGTFHSSIGRTVKLLKDSLFNGVHVQIIRLDLKKVSPETAGILLDQMKKLLERGDTFWEVRDRFSHTSAQFTSGPQLVDDVTAKYGVGEDEMLQNAYFEWEQSNRSVGIVIIDEEPHPVPGFCTVSFLTNDN